MGMSDIVLALLPSLLMFFAVSLGANSLERMVQNYARGRFELDRIAMEANAVRDRLGAIRLDYDKLNEQKAALELKLSERQTLHGEMVAREVEFSDAQAQVFYEVGVPRPRESGWYIKAIGPEMHEIFSGPGSVHCPFPGRRAARLVIWGKMSEEMARLQAKKVFGALSEIMVIRRFDGKLKLSDV